MTSGSLDDTQLLEIDGTRDERLARRVAELYESDPQFRAAAPLPEVIEAACTPDLRLTLDLRDDRRGLRRSPGAWTACPRVGDRRHRPHVGATAAPVRDHQLPRGVGPGACDRQRLAPRPPHPVTTGDVVATVGFSSADYLVVDMVCAYLGLVTVPLQHNASVSRLRPIIEECEPRIVTVSAEYLDLAVESVLTSPSLRQLMVFDYRPEVDEQRENFESARARLQEAGAQVVVTTVDEVVERGSQLPAGPAYTEGSDERLAMIMYTSGNTTHPRRVHRSRVWASYRSFAQPAPAPRTPARTRRTPSTLRNLACGQTRRH